MTQRDCVVVGMKLFGVYFAVLGVIALATSMTTIASDIVLSLMDDPSYRPRRTGKALGLVSLLQPLAYVVCAFALTRRTSWCLRTVGVTDIFG